MDNGSRGRRFARYLRQVIVGALRAGDGHSLVAQPPDIHRAPTLIGVNWAR
ncbi:hypothetical protein [Luethyella okanaganae]|uniref:Uncharacterized protein n=1 Tax=Luethyella okanaganae TaxID=69372 RepID=A0ABW1VCA7_9MICO